LEEQARAAHHFLPGTYVTLVGLTEATAYNGRSGWVQPAPTGGGVALQKQQQEPGQTVAVLVDGETKPMMVQISKLDVTEAGAPHGSPAHHSAKVQCPVLRS
jgi:hypothetical protein